MGFIIEQLYSVLSSIIVFLSKRGRNQTCDITGNVSCTLTHHLLQRHPLKYVRLLSRCLQHLTAARLLPSHHLAFVQATIISRLMMAAPLCPSASYPVVHCPPTCQGATLKIRVTPFQSPFQTLQWFPSSLSVKTNYPRTARPRVISFLAPSPSLTPLTLACLASAAQTGPALLRAARCALCICRSRNSRCSSQKYLRDSLPYPSGLCSDVTFSGTPSMTLCKTAPCTLVLLPRYLCEMLCSLSTNLFTFPHSF